MALSNLSGAAGEAWAETSSSAKMVLACGVLQALVSFSVRFFFYTFFLTRAYTIRFAKYFKKEYLYGLVQFGMIMFNLGLNFGFNSLGDQV
jgi:hypothetical protein